MVSGTRSLDLQGSLWDGKIGSGGTPAAKFPDLLGVLVDGISPRSGNLGTGLLPPGHRREGQHYMLRLPKGF